MYPRIAPDTTLITSVKMAPIPRPVKLDMAVASDANLLVKAPVECSVRSKKAMSCLRVDLKEANRTCLAYH